MKLLRDKMVLHKKYGSPISLGKPTNLICVLQAVPRFGDFEAGEIHFSKLT